MSFAKQVVDIVAKAESEMAMLQTNLITLLLMAGGSIEIETESLREFSGKKFQLHMDHDAELGKITLRVTETLPEVEVANDDNA